MNKAPIAILGAGNMASALALALARHKRPIHMYSIEPDVEADICVNHRNEKYLAGHRFPANVTASSDISAVLNGAVEVFLAVPSFAMKEVLTKARPFLHPKAVLASIIKGLDPKTHEPLIISEAKLLPPAIRKRLCTIGGPAVATEMATGSPTGLVIGGKDKAACLRIKHLLEYKHIKVEISSDLLGVGLGGALKNPYAIALGICDGLKFPTNGKALVLTVALKEMAHIMHEAGAKPETAMGLSGLGDLFVTGMSPHGRNRTYGERLIGAKSKDPKMLGLTTVEGIAATKAATKLVKQHKIKAPLLMTIAACLNSKSNYEQPFIRYMRTLKLD